MSLSVIFKKLTISASLTGGLLSFFIFMGSGYTGIILMSAFFVLGSSATSWRIKTKQTLGLAEINKGRRNAAQVIANAGVPAILGLIAYIFPLQKDIFSLMIACAFSSATADTLSSELGNIYGSNFYNIVTFKKDERGLNGVISVEGTFFGFAGSIIISLLYNIGLGRSLKSIMIIILAGTLGNIADSIIGATSERKQILNNNLVNFCNTLIASMAGFVLYIIMRN
jgi:uncharacterized protein (TIGR00297 family)